MASVAAFIANPGPLVLRHGEGRDREPDQDGLARMGAVRRPGQRAGAGLDRDGDERRARARARSSSRTTLASIPLGRWGRPEDVAAAALFLCSPGRLVDHGLRAGGRRRADHHRPRRDGVTAWSFAARWSSSPARSAGIGWSTAWAFASAGATVVAAARRVDRLERPGRGDRARGGTASAVACDVTDRAVGRRRCATAVVERSGGATCWSTTPASRRRRIPRLSDRRRSRTVVRTNFARRHLRHQGVPARHGRARERATS